MQSNYNQNSSTKCVSTKKMARKFFICIAIMVVTAMTMVLSACNSGEIFTISFNTDNGSPVAPQQIVMGEKIEKPDDPSKDGYEFLGWYTDADFNYKWDFENGVVVMDMTLYAKWEAEEILPDPDVLAVVFNKNGGTGQMQYIEMTEGQTISLPQNTFKRDFFTFTGWNTKADGTGTAYADKGSLTIADTSITLYAMWLGDEFTLKYNANGGIGSEITQTVRAGTRLTLATPVFTKAGSIPSGWNTKPDGTGNSYGDGAQITMPTNDLTLYVVWAEASFFSFSQIADGSFQVSASGISTTSSISIPASYNQKPVSAIADDAFVDVTGVTAITVPSSIKQIGENAFALGSIANINFSGDQVPQITDYPFAITTVITVPDSALEDYKTDWYDYSSNIYSFDLVDGEYIIEDDVLIRYIGSASQVDIADSFVSIGVNAFAYNPYITLVSLGANVEEIKANAFYGATALEQIELSSKLEVIGAYAFANTALKNIELPAALNFIGSDAFYNCASLTQVVLNGSAVVVADGDLFDGCTALTTIKVPSALVSAYKAADAWSQYSTKIS